MFIQNKQNQAIHEKYNEQGFSVLGFPCNQFKEQDPKDNSEIAQFCQLNYGVSFPIFEKGDVNGPNEQPLFTHLKAAAPGIFGSKKIKWNFTKFLVDKNGKPVKRFAPTTTPEQISKDIEKLIIED